MTTKKTAEQNTAAQVAEIEAFFERKAIATAPAWMPKPGDILVGTIIGRRMQVSEHRTADRPDGRYPVIIYQTENGPRSVHAFHSVLCDALREIGVKDGARHAITYDGKAIKSDARDKAEDELEQTDSYHMYYAEDLDNTAKANEEDFTL